MFDIGWGELVVIGVVALIVIGPKELPTVLRTLGQAMAKVKRMASEFQGQFQEAIRESEFHDLQKHAEDLKSSFSGVTDFDPMAETQAEVERALEAPTNPAPDDTVSADATLVDPDDHVIAAEPDGAALAAMLPSVDVPPPEPAEPVTEKDFVTAEPPPKSAGGPA